MPQRPGRLNGLRHLALTAPNLEECERFYVDVLGMEVLNRASKDLVYLTCGNDNLSLGRARKEQRRSGDGSLRLHRRQPGRTPRLVRIPESPGRPHARPPLRPRRRRP